MKKSIVFIISIWICVAVLGGCGCARQEEGGVRVHYKEGGTGVISLPLTHFDTFNPVLTQSDTVLDAMTLVYDSLYRRAADGRMEPVLATKTEISADGLVYTVHLRNDVRWHNGDLFSAYDVSYTLSAIENAPASKLKGYLAGIASYTAKSNFVFELTLTAPNSCFIERLDFPVIARKTDCTAVQADYVPNGTSAYRYAPSVPGRIHILEKNPDCVTQTTGKVEQVVLKELPRAADRMYALESREIEAVHVDTAQLRTYSPKGNVVTFPYTNREFTFLGINAQGALADKQVRGALSAILDREAIKNNAMFGRFVTSTLPFLPGSAYHPAATEKPAPDAEALLTAAGYEKAANGSWQKETEAGMETLSVSVLVNADNDVRVATAEEIAKQFNAFGIGTSVEKTDFDTYNLRVEAREYTLFLGEVLLLDDLDVKSEAKRS